MSFLMTFNEFHDRWNRLAVEINVNESMELTKTEHIHIVDHYILLMCY